MSSTGWLAGYGPATRELVTRVGERWPEHRPHLERRFTGTAASAAIAEFLAGRILQILGERLEAGIQDYRWMCQKILEEEHFFGYADRYRHSSFAEVRAAVYDDTAYMARYTNGLLISQLLWANHTAALSCYRTEFLSLLRPQHELLEVGPGHGLLLALAAERLHTPVSGWDVSATSLDATRRALSAMGIASVRLARTDLLEASGAERFDAVVASELLEHLEDPATALSRLRDVTRPGGRLFLNIPINSPAPDHIYLWRTPEEVYEFIMSKGLDITGFHTYPMTGMSEAQARAAELTMTCVAVCRRPGRESGSRERHSRE